MDYSEIIIYIIVISIIFISSFRKKKTSKSKPVNSERPQKTAFNIPEPATLHNPPPPPQSRKMIINSKDNISSTGSIPNLHATSGKTEIIPDSKPDIYNDVYNAPEFNREELRKAIITYEILKTKF